jgi:nucleoid-associated protein YgaU
VLAALRSSNPIGATARADKNGRRRPYLAPVSADGLKSAAARIRYFKTGLHEAKHGRSNKKVRGGGVSSGHGGEFFGWKIFDACTEMNDPAVKLALALSILIGGFLAATAFRPDPAQPRPAAPYRSEVASLRNRRPRDLDAPAFKERTAAATPSPAVCTPPTRPPTMLAPLDNPPAVPALSKRYPGDGAPTSTGWGLPVAPLQQDSLSGKPPRLHRIVDGDTLTALAKRYLGSADLAMEIFKANREVLSDPDLLPIGAELKIPQ